MSTTDIKTTSFRATILLALADGAIVTIDDLQTRMNEPRRKIQDNVQHAVKESLVKRLRDDVTRLPAYQITSQGRAHLAGVTNKPKKSTTTIATLADTVANWTSTADREDIGAVGEKPIEGVEAGKIPDGLEIAAPDPTPAPKPATDLQPKSVAEKYLNAGGGHLVFYESMQDAQDAAITSASAGDITEVYALVPVGTAYPQAAAEWRPA